MSLTLSLSLMLSQRHALPALSSRSTLTDGDDARSTAYVRLPRTTLARLFDNPSRQQRQQHHRLGPPVLHLPLPNRSQRPPTTLHNLRPTPRPLDFSPPCGAQRRLWVCRDLGRGRRRLGERRRRKAGGRRSYGLSGQLSVVGFGIAVGYEREVRAVALQAKDIPGRE
jgi:hypothetical protein